MKFVLLLYFVIPATSYAGQLNCPDFSGTFVETSSSEVLNVNQWGCTTMRMSSRNIKCATYDNQLVFDGAKYSTPGSQNEWQSYVIQNNAILGDHEWVEMGTTYHSKEKIYLDSKQNLIQEFSLPDSSGNYVVTDVRTFTSAMGDGAPEIPSCQAK